MGEWVVTVPSIGSLSHLLGDQALLDHACVDLLNKLIPELRYLLSDLDLLGLATLDKAVDPALHLRLALLVQFLRLM